MIAEALHRELSQWRPAGPGPHSFHADAGNGWSVDVTAERAESLGCRASEVQVQRPRSPQPVSAAELTQWAVRSAARITGLLEPLRLIEVDAGRSEALLRSDKPAVRGDSLQYYELLLSGRHAARLRRIQAPRAGGRREAIPFDLTHESIAKLVEDIVAD